MSDSLQPQTVAQQAPLCMGFSRQKYWRALPFPSPCDFPNPEAEAGSPTLQQISEPPGKPKKGRGTRDKIANIHWIKEKAREFQKNIYLCFIDYAKAFHCLGHNKLGKFLKRWEKQTTLPVSWETRMQIKKQQLEHGTFLRVQQLEHGTMLLLLLRRFSHVRLCVTP